jgi:hypothetical protein
MQAAFEALNQDEFDTLGEAAQNYSALKLLQAEVTAAVGVASRALIEALEEQGLTRADAPGAKISLVRKKKLGIKEGTSPDDMLQHREDARRWVEELNPTQPDIGVTNLKRTLDVLWTEDPDAPMPNFLVEHEVPQLSVKRT